MTASVAIPAAAYQVLYILNVTQENTGPVTVSGAINRDLVTNLNQPIEPSYLVPGMALLCIDTGTELRLLSYGADEAILAAAEAAADRAEEAAAAAEAAAGGLCRALLAGPMFKLLTFQTLCRMSERRVMRLRLMVAKVCINDLPLNPLMRERYSQQTGHGGN